MVKLTEALLTLIFGKPPVYERREYVASDGHVLHSFDDWEFYQWELDNPDGVDEGEPAALEGE